MFTNERGPGAHHDSALVSMCVIVTTVVLRGVAVEPELRGPPLHAVSLIRSGVFEAIGVISFAVCPFCVTWRDAC